MTLVGSDPAPEVLALRGTEGLEVTGTVKDVRPFYHHADIALAPLRMGGGTRLKILEAMAAGVPVISTAVGAEGLGGRIRARRTDRRRNEPRELDPSDSGTRRIRRTEKGINRFWHAIGSGTL